MDLPFDIKSPLSDEQLEEAGNALIRQAKDDELISRLCKNNSLTDEELKQGLVYLQRYLSDKKRCQGCLNFSSCRQKEAQGMRVGLKYDALRHSFDNFTYPCDYFKTVRERLKHFVFSSYDPLEAYSCYAAAEPAIGIGDPKKDSPSLLNIGRKVFHRLKVYKADQLNPGFFISSSNTNGEGLLKALAYAYAKKDLDVACFDAYQVSDYLSTPDAQANKENLADFLSYSHTPVLFLYNLGREKNLADYLKSFLVPLLTDRQFKGAVTFLSSYKDWEEYLGSCSKCLSGLDELIKPLIDDGKNVRKIIDIAYF